MDFTPVDFDAVILAGGRSSRLGGSPKQDLVFGGSSLLALALEAASGATRRVVVGPDPGTLPSGVRSCRESPEFSGPAAAVAAGLVALDAGVDALGGPQANAPSAYVLVLACDMPQAAEAVQALQAALPQAANAGKHGVMARSVDGTDQPLAGFYNTAELKKSAAALAAVERLANGSVRALLASLDVQPVTVPAGSTADVDTWDDAAALGIAAGNQAPLADPGPGGRSYLGGST